jgi:tryptophan synthase alpha chain
MADGLTIQRASRVALAGGTTLAWIVEALQGLPAHPALYLMTYLNPVLGLRRGAAGREARRAGVRGLVVPDLPLEEVELLQPLARRRSRARSPGRSHHAQGRLRRLCAVRRELRVRDHPARHHGAGRSWMERCAASCDRVRAASGATARARGFGVRAPEQAAALRAHADGVVVGSALVEDVDAGRDPTARLHALREAMRS